MLEPGVFTLPTEAITGLRLKVMVLWFKESRSIPLWRIINLDSGDRTVPWQQLLTVLTLKTMLARHFVMICRTLRYNCICGTVIRVVAGDQRRDTYRY
jgi:hypothetical protein